ncbi:hypothetical protein NW762_014163 [Fusarium torreyae]|uniref:Uncharacterized protein n=1 Tax=Fusarium torreyae TaxID=1237075 RepID=A0A9W8V9S8_9HYPO|nr:hypothetical protein NW762_014163 [Fusarium torreyae]
MPPLEFLTFPYELRHHIYRDYFTLSDGYTFQPGSGKLATADGQPLELSLMYTCRFIASETKSLPLMWNNISFSTVYRPEWSSWAGRFDYLLRAEWHQRIDILLSLGRFITPGMISQIAATYPWFVPQLNIAMRDLAVRSLYRMNSSYCRTWPLSKTLESESVLCFSDYPAESTLHRAVDFTLRLLAQSSDEKLVQMIAGIVGYWQGCRGLEDFLDQCYEPWDIPSRTGLDALGRALGDDELWRTMGHWHRNERNTNEYRPKFRFSATAVAIRFLNHLPLEKRLCIRNLVLREDHIAVGRQECHSLGLIPFCKENSQLRISLHVSMVTNLFQRAALPKVRSFDELETITEQKVLNRTIPEISSVVGSWLTEALVLTDAGMPADSYTLTLDGEHAIELCTSIFQHEVHRRVAIQRAVERCFPWPPEKQRQDPFRFLNRKFPEAFKHLVNETTYLRTNFNPGNLWNVNRLIAYYSGYHIAQFHEEFGSKSPHNFFASSHEPLLGALLMENYECRPCPWFPEAIRRWYSSH